jgi:hypothetical protein
MRRGTFTTTASFQKNPLGPISVKKTVVAPSALPSLPTSGAAPIRNELSLSKDPKSQTNGTDHQSVSDQTANGTKQASIKDLFRLRYLRFLALDMDATIDFYTTIGMNMDFKSEQGIWVNPHQKKERNTTNQIQGKSKKDEEPLRLPPLASFTAKKTVTGFSFRAPGSATVDPNDNIQLIFEKEIAKDDSKRKEVGHIAMKDLN